jgi:hypothetical protein
MAISYLPDVKSALASALCELESATRDCGGGGRGVSYDGDQGGVYGATCCLFLGWEPLMLALSVFVRILVLVCPSGRLLGLRGLGRRLVVADCHGQSSTAELRPCSDGRTRRWMRDKAGRATNCTVSRFAREELIGYLPFFSHAQRAAVQPLRLRWLGRGNDGFHCFSLALTLLAH